MASLDPKEEPPTESDRIVTILKTRFPSLLSCLRSLPFITTTGFFCLAMLRFTFYLAQFSILVNHHFTGDDGTVGRLGRILSFGLAAGVLASVACGSSIDYLRAIIHPRVQTALSLDAHESVYWLNLCPHAAAMVIVTASAAVLSSLVFIASETVYYIGYVALILLRGFLFSTISSFIMTAFPIEQFGTLYGISGSLAGAFSCIQYGLITTTPEIGNIIAFFTVPLMAAVPATVFIKALTTWKYQKN